MLPCLTVVPAVPPPSAARIKSEPGTPNHVGALVVWASPRLISELDRFYLFPKQVRNPRYPPNFATPPSYHPCIKTAARPHLSPANHRRLARCQPKRRHCPSKVRSLRVSWRRRKRGRHRRRMANRRERDRPNGGLALRGCRRRHLP